MDELLYVPEETETQSIKQKAKRSLYASWERKGNYFIIALLALVSFLFSFVRFDNATIALKLPNYDNAFGWIVFVFMTVFPAVIGLGIKSALRKQGIKIALETEALSKLQDTYNNLLTTQTIVAHKPRSITEYTRSAMGKEIFYTVLVGSATTLLMVGVALSGGWEGLIKQLINFLMWAIFGLKSMLDANDFVLHEYKQWLIIHIKDLQNKEQT